ncbi:LLM class flavin-dependent oxidoreductase, partial [Mycolicibacterium arseniciresistens]
MFTMRFDMRTSAGAAARPDLYAAAVEMCEWAETRGALVAVLSEHHATDDGHLAAPHLLAAAIAARTRQLGILLAAVPIPFWDPVRLAEEMAALDIISRGRVSYAFGIGHREAEYEHFGVEQRTRGRSADQRLALVLRMIRGEAVEIDGRRVRISPPCVTAGGPAVL